MYLKLITDTKKEIILSNNHTEGMTQTPRLSIPLTGM